MISVWRVEIEAKRTMEALIRRGARSRAYPTGGNTHADSGRRHYPPCSYEEEALVSGGTTRYRVGVYFRSLSTGREPGRASWRWCHGVNGVPSAVDPVDPADSV